MVMIVRIVEIVELVLFVRIVLLVTLVIWVGLVIVHCSQFTVILFPLAFILFPNSPLLYALCPHPGSLPSAFDIAP